MGKIRVDEITNEAGNGPPEFPNGIRAATVTDEAGTGAPEFPNGIRAATVTDEAGTGAPSFPFGAEGIESVPTGALMHFSMNTPPTGWLKANGASISRTTYSALFDAIGTTFGAGDGSTTFGLPDLRGEFLRGWDDGRGVDSGRSFGSAQLDQMQRLTGLLDIRAGSTIAACSLWPSGVSGVFSTSGTSSRALNAFLNSNTPGRRLNFNSASSPGARVSSNTNGETRSRNVAMLACIKF